MVDISTRGIVPVAKRSALGTSRRELSEDVSFGIGTVGTIAAIATVGTIAAIATVGTIAAIATVGTIAAIATITTIAAIAAIATITTIATALLAPSWLSSNRAWKTAPGGCDAHRRTRQTSPYDTLRALLLRVADVVIFIFCFARG